MLKDQDIICISSIDWDFIWQQHQSIMSAFAKAGNRVLFIENTGARSVRFRDLARLRKRLNNRISHKAGFRKVAGNLQVYSPVILPLPYFMPARLVNKFLLAGTIKKWMSENKVTNPIIWTFLPTPLVLDIVDTIPHKAFIYYCTDNISATSKSARRVLKYEREVLRRADAVFVMAKNMLDYCRSYNNNVTRIPMGVDVEVFKNAENRAIRPEEMSGINGRVIGYVGGIKNTIDQRLVGYLAEKMPDHTFIFVGPVQTDISYLERFKNVTFTGQKPHSELPGYIKYFDACIIPYVKNTYSDNICLAKLNEYLIMGKPVISTNLKETENFSRENNDILYIAKDYDDFVRLAREAMISDCDALRAARREIAFSNGWDKKVEQMSGIVEKDFK